MGREQFVKPLTCAIAVAGLVAGGATSAAAVGTGSNAGSAHHAWYSGAVTAAEVAAAEQAAEAAAEEAEEAAEEAEEAAEEAEEAAEEAEEAAEEAEEDDTAEARREAREAAGVAKRAAERAERAVSEAKRAAERVIQLRAAASKPRELTPIADTSAIVTDELIVPTAAESSIPVEEELSTPPAEPAVPVPVVPVAPVAPSAVAGAADPGAAPIAGVSSAPVVAAEQSVVSPEIAPIAGDAMPILVSVVAAPVGAEPAVPIPVVPVAPVAPSAILGTVGAAPEAIVGAQRTSLAMATAVNTQPTRLNVTPIAGEEWQIPVTAAEVFPAVDAVAEPVVSPPPVAPSAVADESELPAPVARLVTLVTQRNPIAIEAQHPDEPIVASAESTRPVPTASADASRQRKAFTAPESIVLPVAPTTPSTIRGSDIERPEALIGWARKAELSPISVDAIPAANLVTPVAGVSWRIPVTAETRPPAPVVASNVWIRTSVPMATVRHLAPLSVAVDVPAPITGAAAWERVAPVAVYLPPTAASVRLPSGNVTLRSEPVVQRGEPVAEGGSRAAQRIVLDSVANRPAVATATPPLVGTVAGRAETVASSSVGAYAQTVLAAAESAQPCLAEEALPSADHQLDQVGTLALRADAPGMLSAVAGMASSPASLPAAGSIAALLGVAFGFRALLRRKWATPSAELTATGTDTSFTTQV